MLAQFPGNRLFRFLHFHRDDFVILVVVPNPFGKLAFGNWFPVSECFDLQAAKETAVVIGAESFVDSRFVLVSISGPKGRQPQSCHRRAESYWPFDEKVTDHRRHAKNEDLPDSPAADVCMRIMF